MKSTIFGPSQSKSMLKQKVDSMEDKIRILTEENTSLNQNLERKIIELSATRNKLENSRKLLQKQYENNEEKKEENFRLYQQLRQEREDHARKLRETEEIIEEDMKHKMEDVLDDAKFLSQLQTFDREVILQKANAYKIAYYKVFDILKLDIESYDKLREFDDSAIIRLQTKTFKLLTTINEELKEQKREAESRKPPTRKPKLDEAKPIKPKLNVAPPHPPTEAELAMELKEGYTYYDVLKVPQSATFEDIKKAYRKQALTWHVDKQFLHNKSEEVMHEAFTLVGEAFEVLKDEKLRKMYNNYLLSNSHKTFRPGMLFPGFKFSDPYKTFARFESNKFCINKFSVGFKSF